MFWIPPGFAHGFLVLSDYAEFAYKCTDFYHPNDEGGLAWNDPDIGVTWPIPEGMELTISEKDQKWALTASAVAKLCGCNRPAINRYFEEHRLAIADHNAKHQLTASHNISKGRKGKPPHG